MLEKNERKITIKQQHLLIKNNNRRNMKCILNAFITVHFRWYYIKIILSIFFGLSIEYILKCRVY